MCIRDRGQAVRQGQLLVSGYCDWDGRIQATRAYGEIYAQTPVSYTHLDVYKRQVMIGSCRAFW